MYTYRLAACKNSKVKHTVIIIHAEISIFLHKLTMCYIKKLLNLRRNTLRWLLQTVAAYRKYTTFEKLVDIWYCRTTACKSETVWHFDNSWSDGYTYTVGEILAQKSVVMWKHVTRGKFYFVALRLNAGHGFLILDVSTCISHTMTYHCRYDSSGRVISSSQRPLPDTTQHSQQIDIHALSEFETTISASKGRGH
jgi:hypothetical protein